VEVAISNLVDMGFPRPMVLQAMQAARNNPDIAVSILTGVCFFSHYFVSLFTFLFLSLFLVGLH
jgi:hypothetical protein